MKKIFYLSFLVSSLILVVASCDFRKDNFGGPDAQFFGGLKDSLDGALVQQDMQTGSTIGAYEWGYSTQVLQTWYPMLTGEFRNNLVFSNWYRIDFQSCNFFPNHIDSLKINPGANQHDFTVVPYIRIKNVSITADTATTKKITATFTIEGGRPSVKVAKVSLYAFTDIYVSENVKFTFAGSLPATDPQPTKSLSGAAQIINPATTYTLQIDWPVNKGLFKIHRNYYFRVGAMGIQSGVGTIRANFAPYVKIAL